MTSEEVMNESIQSNQLIPKEVLQDIIQENKNLPSSIIAEIPMVKAAIEYLFDVKVKKVNTNHLPKKKKRVGKFSGYKPQNKKAIVTLAENDTINLFFISLEKNICIGQILLCGDGDGPITLGLKGE